MSREPSADALSRGLVRALPDRGFVLDADGRFLEVLGDGAVDADPERFLGRTVFDVWPERTAERWLATIRAAVEADAVRTLTYDLSTDGRTRTVEARCAPIPGDDGEPSSVVWAPEEVTSSADPARWLSRLADVVAGGSRPLAERLDSLFDLGCERFGHDVGLLARHDPGADRAAIEYTSAEDGPFAAEERLSLDGAAAEGGRAVSAVDLGDDATVSLGPRIGVDGGPDRTLAFVSTGSRDRSPSDEERLFLELAGRWVTYELGRRVREARERRMAAVFDGTARFMGLLEPDGTLIEANRAALEFGGVDREAVTGRKLWDTYWFSGSEGTRRRAREAVDRAADGEYVRDELTVRGADSETVIDLSIRPVTDEDGTVTLLVSEGRDVTEREEHAARFRALTDANRRLWEAESEAELAEVTVDVVETVLDEGLAVVWSYDESDDELVPLAASDAATALDGSLRADDIDPIADDTTEMAAFRRGETTVVEDYGTAEGTGHPETPLGALLIAPLGEFGQLHVGVHSASGFDDEVRKLLDGLANTVEAALERLSRERKLERSRERLARTEQLATVGGWELDVETEALTWTDGTRRIYGTDDDYEPTLEEAVDFFHPEDRSDVTEALERCRATGAPYELEARLVTATGHERRVEVAGEAIVSDGDVVRLAGAIRDVTDRTHREQQLSVLHRILRHNLRNDLNVVRGFADAIDRELDRLDAAPGSDGAVEQSVDELRTYTDRIRETTEGLVSIGDKANRIRQLITGDSGEDSVCRVSAAVDAAVADVESDHPSVDVDVDDLPEAAVEASLEAVVFVLRELLDNAVVHAESADPDVAVRSERVSADHVALDVVDWGSGIPSDELEALRRDEEAALSHGSGIGLWVVNWLVSSVGGFLDFETTDGRGTAVTVTLPVANDSPDAPTAAVPTRAAGGSGTPTGGGGGA
ncbi:PAS domain-containing protein [Haloplanus halophilus]|uniref:PAS domain-containing protein n=1 Tax=Haloplanus halophilus TaxID=2949993 RepID=UPI00203FBE0A|nr:PAS domain-containing protein [Haloplanus sp. GDY1]